MPIYEFYCPPCDTLYNFFSSRIDTAARPDCPRCGRPRLERKPARFAALTRSAAGGEGGAGGDDEGFGGEPGGDEERLGAAFESVLGELEASGASPEDPRQMAALFRRVGEAAGLEPGPQMEEMLHRLESGADPEALEEEMGGAFDESGAEGEGDPLADLFRRKRPTRRRRPRVDSELYFL